MKAYRLGLIVTVLICTPVVHGQTVDLKGRVEKAVANLSQNASDYYKDSKNTAALENYLIGLEDYDHAWDEYRQRVILTEFYDHYMVYEKLEQKVVGPTYKKIKYITWLKRGADENDPDFLLNGEDPISPTPPWHADPSKDRATFEKEKTTYKAMIPDWSDTAAIQRKLEDWRNSATEDWVAARTPLLKSMEPVAQRAYFTGQKLPSNSGNFPLPTNMQDSYIQEIEYLQPICAKVTANFAASEFTVNLKTICEAGPKAVPDFGKLSLPPKLALLFDGGNHAVDLPRPTDRGDLMAMSMAQIFKNSVHDLAYLPVTYNRILHKAYKEPSEGHESEFIQNQVTKLLNSKDASH
jgi:hypothetical protein